MYFVLDRVPVIALVERLEVERLAGLGGPQSEQVDGRYSVPEDRRVVGHAAHGPLGDPAHAVPPALVRRGLGPSAEMHVQRQIGPHDLPWVAAAQPLVRDLDLLPIANRLIEDPELVADAVADRRDLERRERLHVARGETSESAVAQPRLLFFGQQLVEVEPEVAAG